MNEASPDSVASPCRDVCRLDDGGICIGCGRSAYEIEEWPRAGRERRLQICALARARSAVLEAPKGGKLPDGYPG